MASDGRYTFVCNVCGKPVDTDTLAGACNEADAHERHANHRDFYVIDPDEEVVLGEKDREPRDAFFEV